MLNTEIGNKAIDITVYLAVMFIANETMKIAAHETKLGLLHALRENPLNLPILGKQREMHFRSYSID